MGSKMGSPGVRQNVCTLSTWPRSVTPPEELPLEQRGTLEQRPTGFSNGAATGTGFSFCEAYLREHWRHGPTSACPANSSRGTAVTGAIPCDTFASSTKQCSFLSVRNALAARRACRSAAYAGVDDHASTSLCVVVHHQEVTNRLDPLKMKLCWASLQNLPAWPESEAFSLNLPPCLE